MTLRDGWQRVKFGDVVRNVSDTVVDPAGAGLKRAVGLEHLESGELAITQWASTADGLTFTRRFRAGQILYGRRRVYQRKAAVPDFDGVCSGDIYVLEPASEALLPELLPFIVLSEPFHEHALRTSAGSLSPRTKWADLRQYEFKLPPIDEQRRAAELLWAVQAEALGLRRTRKCVASVRRALVASRLGVVEGTERSTLGELCTVQVGYPFKSAEYADTGTRLLRGSNVSVGRLRWEDDLTRYWPDDRVAEFAEYALRVGDVVIAMDRPFVGDGFKIARVAEEDLPALLLQRVGRVQPADPRDLDFIWLYLHSGAFHQHLLRLQKGTDLPHVSRFDIESAPLPRLTSAQRVELTKQFEMLERCQANLDRRLAENAALRDVLSAQLLSEGSE